MPETKLDSRFQANLKKLRTRLKMSQAQFAEAVDMHSNTIARMERGDMRPSFETIEGIAETFGKDPSWLLRR